MLLSGYFEAPLPTWNNPGICNISWPHRHLLGGWIRTQNTIKFFIMTTILKNWGFFPLPLHVGNIDGQNMAHLLGECLVCHLLRNYFLQTSNSSAGLFPFADACLRLICAGTLMLPPPITPADGDKRLKQGFHFSSSIQNVSNPTLPSFSEHLNLEL